MSLTLFRLTASRVSHLRRQFSSSMATASTVSDLSSKPAGPVESSIREKLTTLLQPTSLFITNDSWKHRHHAPMRDHKSDGEPETHFTIDVTSSVFEGKSTMQRHRLIYSALSTELAEGLHSLSLKTKSQAEAEKQVVT
ncbi:bola protein [Armillaria luteobubalina]|uniref:Bola protein n=1 Tax=Armillaria luteobubalina TaxID=153913 RepID=A0AA39PTM2_9AGAR|nr:bola protein [Armillaria luteobubalina]